MTDSSNPTARNRGHIRASTNPGALHPPPTRRRVHRLELAIETPKHVIDHNTDPTDWMIRRNQVIGAQRRQHRQLAYRDFTHVPILFDPATEREHQSKEFQHPASVDT